MKAVEGMTLEKLQVIIEAQTKAYYEELKKVQAQTKQATNVVKKQTDIIKAAFSKIGRVVGAALSVVALVNFAKGCIELGSALAEVQNVVDVTFGAMSDTINKFARDALEKFGLSETKAKQYTSTLGAMLKSMGMTTSQAADMSMELTGLAADMASFYNLDTDVAFQKIRAGISGETEPLKQLGINLSVANLQEYALSQGITKSYNAMNQQEQALLRYNYLLSVTADAQGDFARTSDGWANQVRVLTERWNALKAAIGQGLIAVLTPVIRVLNQVLAKILTVTDAFSNMISKFTGKNTKTSTSVKDMGDNLGGAAGAAGDLTDATTAAGKATEKAGKAAKKAEEAYHGLANFDEIHSLNKEQGDEGSGGSGGSGGGGGAGSGLEESIVDAANEADDTLNPVLEKIINRLKELADLFKQGFKAGMGNVTLEPLKKAIEGIKKSLIDIWTDPAVVNSANRYLDTLAYSMGQKAGALASIGITIATNILGGIDKYLAQNKQRIKNFIVSMFDISSEINVLEGNYAQAVANIFSVFGGENAQQATANLIGIFADAGMGIAQIFMKLKRDIETIFMQPFIDNQEKIKTALDGTLGVLAGLLGNVKDIVDNTMDKANEVYDAHLAPMFQSIASGLSEVVGAITDAYNDYILPVLEGLQEKVGPLIEQHIQPAINKGLELIGKIADAIKDIWEQTLQPFIMWYIQNVAPYIAEGLRVVGEIFLWLFGVVSDVVGHIFDALGGLIDFIAGVFTGDWERAWKGIKTFFTNIWEAIKTILGAAWEAIKAVVKAGLAVIEAVISAVLNVIKTIFTTVWNAIYTLIMTIWNAIKTFISNTINTISTIISTVLNAIKTVFTTIWNAIYTLITTIWNAMKQTISTTINTISTVISTVLNAIKTTFTTIWNAISTTVSTIWNAMKQTISTTINTISTTVSTVLNSIKNVFSTIWNAISTTVSTVINTIKTTISNALSAISTNWSTMWNGMKTAVEGVFSGMWNAIKGTINSILGGVEALANGVVNGINKVIDALNNLSFTVPDWVPELGGKKFGFNIGRLSTISLPRLAEGGIVTSPMVAQIGENGQEAVVPLENNTGWLDKIAARLGEIISVNIQGILQEMDGKDEWIPIKTVVQLDSKTLVEQEDKFRRRKGYQMANG